jgi:hypothetical protein
LDGCFVHVFRRLELVVAEAEEVARELERALLVRWDAAFPQIGCQNLVLAVSEAYSQGRQLAGVAHYSALLLGEALLVAPLPLGSVLQRALELGRVMALVLELERCRVLVR